MLGLRGVSNAPTWGRRAEEWPLKKRVGPVRALRHATTDCAAGERRKSDTPLHRIVTSAKIAAANTLYNTCVLTDEQEAELEQRNHESRDRLQESRDRTEAPRLKLIQSDKLLGRLMNFFCEATA